MSDVAEKLETDTREKILITAERLFREIGYQKTTVADIAKSLQMSPANVYRFFDSKSSINAGVARRLMGEVEQASQTIAARKRKSAEARLRELLTTIHRMNSDRYVADSKMHEMVAVAMEENWNVCTAHMEHLTGLVAAVIAEGVTEGEFDVADVGLAAQCICMAMARFFNPQLIAQCATKPGPTIDQMIDFILASLRQ